MPDSFHSDFAAALCDPETPPPEVVRRSGGKRFDVYRNNRAVALIDVLADIFPTVQRLVGEDFFRAAARVYIDIHPPQGPILLTYGDRFGDFLDGFEPAASVPYLGDIARLEWARRHAYHAADATPVAIDILAEIPADRLDCTCLILLPSLHLIRSRFPIGSIWAGADDVDMRCGENIAVLRPDFHVETTRLSGGAYRFIASLKTGDPLGTAAQAALGEDTEFDLAAHLQGLFALQAVIGTRDRR